MKYYACTAGENHKLDVTVYVIGVPDHIALAALLTDESFGSISDIHDPRIVYREAIGKPDGIVNEAQLRSVAEDRAKELEEQTHG